MPTPPPVYAVIEPIDRELLPGKAIYIHSPKIRTVGAISPLRLTRGDFGDLSLGLQRRRPRLEAAPCRLAGVPHRLLSADELVGL